MSREAIGAGENQYVVENNGIMVIAIAENVNDGLRRARKAEYARRLCQGLTTVRVQ